MVGPGIPLAQLLQSTADAVAAVRAGRSLTDVLARVPADRRAGTQALAFLAMRHLGSALVLRPMLAPRAPPAAVESVLLTALALLWPGDDPPPYADHTLVDQAVQAVRRHSPRSAGFVNAVLRRFVRERAALVAAAQADPLARWQHPPWWVERLRADWPDAWPALLAAANRHPPMALRVNPRQGSVDDQLAALAAAGLAARRVHDAATPHAVVLDSPCAVGQLPGFAQGRVSVQDLSAQRAAPLLLGAAGAAGQAGPTTGGATAGGPADLLPPLAPGARVLDACAAPGGKTAHLLELADLDLLALDADAQRLARVADNLARLQLRAELKAADARDTAAWWDGRPFDAILLDAPCSASGIVRRHPDVRWLRRPTDIDALVRTQAALLDALWPLLKPGGRLLYATCSLFRAEGMHQIEAFLQRHGASGARWWPGSPGHLPGLPDNSDHTADAASGDGFFYALITKP